MTNLEKHGKLIAISLCSMSFVPIASAVAAQETTPGWHGDKYINDDEQVAKGWQEVQGEQYYFNEEDGSLDTDKTQEGTTAALSSKAAEAIEADVKTAVNETVTAEVARYEETAAKEALENVQHPEETAQEQQPEQPEQPEQEELPAQDTQETFEEPGHTEDVLEQPEESFDQEEIYEDQEQETTWQEPVQEQPVLEYMPAEEDEWQLEAGESSEPEYEVADETWQPEEEDAVISEPEAQPVNPYADLNSSIVNTALSLVGSTDGLQCTEVVQMALAGANVSDAMALWPDEYAATYGYYTDEPQPGNLVYYDNGGRGIDHIAIYIGNGNAVHGNFYDENDESHTVIYSVNVPNAGEPQYIQVER